MPQQSWKVYFAFYLFRQVINRKLHIGLRSSFVASAGSSLTFIIRAYDLSGNAENIARRRFEPPLETSLWLFGIDIITDASGIRALYLLLAPRTGLEPVTSRLTVLRSTDWTTEEYKLFNQLF